MTDDDAGQQDDPPEDGHNPLPDDDWTHADSDADHVENEVVEDDDTEPASARAGQAVGAIPAAILQAVLAIVEALARFGKNIAVPITKAVPGAGTLWPALVDVGYKQYAKVTGADAIAHVHRRNGTVDIQPVKWQPDGEEAAYKSYGTDEKWRAPEGHRPRRLGKTPTIQVFEDIHETSAPIEARVAEAVDCGDFLSLREDTTMKQVVIEQQGNEGGEAVADGGANAREYQLTDAGQFKDVLVDIGSDWADGTVVSMTKTAELYQDRATTEEMEAQEMRGRLAEADGDLRAYAFRMLLVAGGIVVGALLAVFVLPELFGGGGGGGGVGSSLPALTALWGL